MMIIDQNEKTEEQCKNILLNKGYTAYLETNDYRSMHAYYIASKENIVFKAAGYTSLLGLVTLNELSNNP